MFKKKFFFSITCLFISCVNAQYNESNNTTLKLLSTKKEFLAGTLIQLKFNTHKSTKYKLYCANSYGSTIITPSKKDSLIFDIPMFLSKKKGIINWSLINTEKVLSGKITITAQNKPTFIETYLGPPSIEAGGKDYAMIVTIPTDILDNPLKKNTPITINQQFLTDTQKEKVFTKNLIAYKNIYSPTKSGRVLISSNCFKLHSKEYDINIMPAIPVNFNVFAKRHHKYADGNQITTLYTSQLKDTNDNIISDGSFVDFFITNSKGNVLKTSGTTINGIATAKIVHPDYEDQWSVKAYVIGIAESDRIILDYKKAIKNYIVSFTEKNRTISIGPLQSFMGQMIPDGLKVKVSLYQNNILIQEFIKETQNGYVYFNLNPNILPKGIYKITTDAAGIYKEFKNIELW